MKYSYARGSHEADRKIKYVIKGSIVIASLFYYKISVKMNY